MALAACTESFRGSRWSSRFTPRVGGGSAFFVRPYYVQEAQQASIILQVVSPDSWRPATDFADVDLDITRQSVGQLATFCMDFVFLSAGYWSRSFDIWDYGFRQED